MGIRRKSEGLIASGTRRVSIGVAALALAADAYRKDPTQSYIPTPRSLVSVLHRRFGVGWATQGHTASPVFTFGSGPGSEGIAGFRHNTELFRIMRESLAQ